MAYQFADGFDNYGNSFTMVAGYPWDFAPNGAEITSTADFRFTPPAGLTGGCVAMGGSGNVLRKNLSGSFGTLIAGVGFKMSSLIGSGQSEVLSFWDSSTEQCCLTVNSLGSMQFARGQGGGTLIGAATPNSTIVANVWYGVAIQVTFGTGTAGSVQAYLNGNPVAIINSTGLNTSNTGNASANQVAIGGNVNTAPSTKFDDFYCFDTTGPFQNALLGADARILTKLPASAGQYTNWTPNGLLNNFQNVAVTPPSTSDFNSNNVASTKDSYTMQTAGLSAAPYFVMVRASMERDDAALHIPSIFVRSGGTDSVGQATSALSSSYVFYDTVFSTDPATSAAWAGAAADAAQAGVIEG